MPWANTLKNCFNHNSICSTFYEPCNLKGSRLNTYCTGWKAFGKLLSLSLREQSNLIRLLRVTIILGRYARTLAKKNSFKTYLICSLTNGSTNSINFAEGELGKTCKNFIYSRQLRVTHQVEMKLIYVGVQNKTSLPFKTTHFQDKVNLELSQPRWITSGWFH